MADCDGWDGREALYDGVAAIFVQFADPAMRARLFANIERCLKPGGVLVLQGYTPKQLEYKTGGPPLASHLYTPSSLREAFTQLRDPGVARIRAEVAEGTGHWDAPR